MPSKFDFNPALPHPIKWSVGENKYDNEGDWPSQLGLQIPLESIPGFCNYLMNLMDKKEKVTTGTVWNYEKNEEVEVDVVWVNGKGKNGSYGSFGSINPQKIEPSQSSGELPF